MPSRTARTIASSLALPMPVSGSGVMFGAVSPGMPLLGPHDPGPEPVGARRRARLPPVALAVTEDAAVARLDEVAATREPLGRRLEVVRGVERPGSRPEQQRAPADLGLDSGHDQGQQQRDRGERDLLLEPHRRPRLPAEPAPRPGF